jgi:glutathione S-transferase
MITLYQTEISPFCDKVRRILAVKRVRYQEKNLRIVQTLARVSRWNPISRVPTLDDDGKILTDSREIAQHLEERFPDPPLVPRQPGERALAHIIEDWADQSLYFYEARLRFTFAANVARTADILLAHEESGLIRRVAALAAPRTMRNVLAKQGIGRKSEDEVLRDVSRHGEAIAGWLGTREWLVGEHLSVADVAVFVQLAAIRSTDEGEKLLAAQPTVLSWMERVDRATRSTTQQNRG